MKTATVPRMISWASVLALLAALVAPLSAHAAGAVFLAVGDPAPHGYRYLITLQGMPANTGIKVSCHDSVDPQGFYTLTLTTNGSGSASINGGSCYSADGPDHWVIANGIQSNTVQWGRGASSHGSGGSTGNPAPNPAPQPSPGSGSEAAPSAAKPSGDIPWPTKPSENPIKVTSPSNLTKVALQDYKLGMHAAATTWRQLKLTWAVNGINNYLNNTGRKLTPPMSWLVKKDGAMLSTYDWYINDRAKKAVDILRQAPTNGSATVQFGIGGDISPTGWNSNSGCEGGSVWCLYGATGISDPAYLLGNFSYTIRGDAWIGPADASGNRAIQVRYRAFAWDWYDFDGALSGFGDLARYGWAKSYPIEISSGVKTVKTTLSQWNGLTVALS